MGFVSADFRDQHPVGIFVQALFTNYNKAEFSFSAYYTSHTFDDSTYYIKGLRKRMSTFLLCDTQGFTMAFEEKIREVIEYAKIKSLA